MTSVKQKAKVNTTSNLPYMELSETHRWVLYNNQWLQLLGFIRVSVGVLCYRPVGKNELV